MRDLEQGRRSAGRDPEAKRRRVLDAARAIFADHGFEGTRMDEVARRARVSKGTVYNIVGSKEELFLRCIADSMEEDRTRIAETVEAESTAGRAIETLIRALFLDLLPSLLGERSLRHHGFTAMGTNPTLREMLLGQLRRFYRDRELETTALLHEGRADGFFRHDVPPEDAAVIVQAVIDGLVFRASLDPDRVQPRRIAEALLALLRPDGGAGEGSA
jgi:AcrR family transcriptional regulator